MATWKKIAYADEVLSKSGDTISAIRGPELAPAITEANWDTRLVGTGFTDPIVGGIIDKGVDGGAASVAAVTAVCDIVEGDFYECIYTVVNSPTTGTFVDGGYQGIGVGNPAAADHFFSSLGTYTFIVKSIGTEKPSVVGNTTSRFGISAISVKKLTEGNLTMDGGQVQAEVLAGQTPGYAFKGHEVAGVAFNNYTGLSFYGDDDGAYQLAEMGLDANGTYFFVPGTIYTNDPTGGTFAGWKLGSVVNNEIEVEVGGDAVLRKLLTEKSNMTLGPELAPSLTDANWETNLSGWVHPVTGGVLDHGSAGETTVTMITPISVSVGDIFELSITTVVSPTTSTFTGTYPNIRIGDDDWSVYYDVLTVGTYTFTLIAHATTGLEITAGDDSRFGISAISVKKLYPSLVLQAAANNAAASAAGVPVNGLYRTNADPSVVCVRTA
jgi:hypothetical protein